MRPDLTTRYLGIELKSPFIFGSCPLAMEPETVRQLVAAGVGAIVLPSMLQEQIVYATLKQHDPLTATEQCGYQPQQDRYNGGPVRYLESIRQYKADYSIPIIASMSGWLSGRWLDFAKEIEASGADALELNWRNDICDPTESAASVEARLFECVNQLCQNVSIPVAVKLSQQFTNIASVAGSLQTGGVSGVVLFSHRPQWDVSLDRMRWTIGWELTPVNSISPILEGIVHARMGGSKISIAASGGVRTGEDAMKAMIAGADAVMVTSEVYRHGPDAMRDLLLGFSRCLSSNHFDSLLAFQQARPAVDVCKGLRLMEYVDPLTRSTNYRDPTPVPALVSGDAFGHRCE